MSKLDEIVAHKRIEIAHRREIEAFDALVERAAAAPRPPSFTGSLRASPMGIIAEVKRRSPSAGTIRDPFDPPAIAEAYAAAGAQAVSVLMDETYFGGGEADFDAVRAAVDLPLLYKEFVVDPWQIPHACCLGASAVLLLAGVLDAATLEAFREDVESLGMEALVEVHDEDQLQAATDAGARCLGVNNRDLSDFSVSLETSLRLVAKAPGDCTLVSESGIRAAEDVQSLHGAGYHAVLVGGHLLSRDEPGAALKELMSLVWACS